MLHLLSGDLLLEILRSLPVKQIARLACAAKGLVPPASVGYLVRMYPAIGAIPSHHLETTGDGQNSRFVRDHLESLLMHEQRGRREMDLLGPNGLREFAIGIKSLGAVFTKSGVHLDDWIFDLDFRHVCIPCGCTILAGL